MIERIYIYILCLIIIIKSEVWTITHCLGLGMKQWYALYVFLYSYSFGQAVEQTTLDDMLDGVDNVQH